MSRPHQRLTAHTACIKALAWSPHQAGFLATGGGLRDHTIAYVISFPPPPPPPHPKLTVQCCLMKGFCLNNVVWQSHLLSGTVRQQCQCGLFNAEVIVQALEHCQGLYNTQHRYRQSGLWTCMVSNCQRAAKHTRLCGTWHSPMEGTLLSEDSHPGWTQKASASSCDVPRWPDSCHWCRSV